MGPGGSGSPYQAQMGQGMAGGNMGPGGHALAHLQR